jgi:periplasmic protein TonB
MSAEPTPEVPAEEEPTRNERRRRPLPTLPVGLAPQSYLQGLDAGISVSSLGVFFASLLTAAIVHLAVAAGAASVQLPKRAERIEMAIFEPKPPPSEPPPPEPPPPEPPPPEPPPEPPKPKEKKPKEPSPKEVLPPPPSNQEPPPEASNEPVPLVTGLSMSSVVENSGGPAMRVGNTTYGDPNKEKYVKPEDVRAYAGGSKEFKPTRVANLSKAARVRTEHRPRYPKALKEEGVEGVVVLQIQITSEGKVRKARVVKGIHPVLDKLSAEAVERFAWYPAEMNGEPVDSVLTYRMTWQLF